LMWEEDIIVFGPRDAESAAACASPDVRGTAMQVFDLAQVRQQRARIAARRSCSRLRR